MKISNGRGRHITAIKNKNRKKILDFINKNPGCTRKEICDNVGIAYITLRRHIDEIRKESK